jgi:hypothetical protein
VKKSVKPWDLLIIFYVFIILVWVLNLAHATQEKKYRKPRARLPPNKVIPDKKNTYSRKKLKCTDGPQGRHPQKKEPEP